MKREIVCPECAEKLRKMFEFNDYPDEHFKFVAGKADSSYNCDQCNRDIHPGEVCSALSIWNNELDRRGRGYYEWETGYIQPIA